MGIRTMNAAGGATVARVSFAAALAAGLVPVQGTAYLLFHAALGAPFAAAVVILTVTRPKTVTIAALSVMVLSVYAGLISRGAFWASPMPLLHVASMTAALILYEVGR